LVCELDDEQRQLGGVRKCSADGILDDDEEESFAVYARKIELSRDTGARVDANHASVMTSALFVKAIWHPSAVCGFES
jgi:hypothetical protein